MSDLRLLTWNVFHCRPGHREVGPTWRSTLLGRAEWDNRHVHVNRKLTSLVAEIIAGAAPQVVALQEVPPGDIEQLARDTGMQATLVRMGPRIGPAGVRQRLSRANPDLWRTHEGNANAILVGGGLTLDTTSVRRLRLNPPGVVAGALRSGLVTAREAGNWAWEERGAVLAKVTGPSGPLTVCCLHLHTRPAAATIEATRLATWLAREVPQGALVVAGDFNLPAAHVAFAPLADLGLRDASTAPGIDRVLVRGGEVRAARRWDPSERERLVRWRGAERIVVVSDHDPVAVELALDQP